jgi:hypothetical protein
MQLIPEPVRPELTPEEQERLGDYAVSVRYPGDYDSITLTEARRAVILARRVNKQIRAHMPKLKRRSKEGSEAIKAVGAPGGGAAPPVGQEDRRCNG